MQKELREAFRLYDKQGNGYIPTSCLKEILRELDDQLTDGELDGMIEEIDSDGSGTVDFDGELKGRTLFEDVILIVIFFTLILYRVHGDDDWRISQAFARFWIKFNCYTFASSLSSSFTTLWTYKRPYDQDILINEISQHKFTLLHITYTPPRHTQTHSYTHAPHRTKGPSYLLYTQLLKSHRKIKINLLFIQNITFVCMYYIYIDDDDCFLGWYTHPLIS